MSVLKITLVAALALFIFSNVSVPDITKSTEQSLQLESSFNGFFSKINNSMKSVLTSLSEKLTVQDQEKLLNDFNSATIGTKELSKEEKSEIQQHLIDLGYEPGPADGIVGKETRLAIYAYQADNGKRIDGKASLALLTHLRSSRSTSVSISHP